MNLQKRNGLKRLIRLLLTRHRACGYRLIAKAPPTAHDMFRKLAAICYNTAKVPDQWKLTQMYPIPKPSDWEYNLGRTRPIILLECIRKLCTKVMTRRLADICASHEILKGPNFMGLRGESTKIPLHTLANVIEDAKEKKKELWIAFQDMAKAFDSIGMTPLRKSLQRL